MSISCENLKDLPDSPGVYFFKDSRGRILYIGKATSLRSRVRSYFSTDLLRTRGPLIAQMLDRAERIDCEKTDSVLEALILEAELVKKYKPPHNTDLKDDKSFNYVVVTSEEFPRVLLVRERALAMEQEKHKAVFGPFTNGLQLKEALRIVRRIFPFRDSCAPETGKPCFNAQIGLCPGVCSGAMLQKEYAGNIRNIILFFRGKKKDISRVLKKEMKREAEALEFEKADKIKKTLFALDHINDVSLLKRGPSAAARTFRIECFDIAHLSGKDTVGAMAVVLEGEAAKSEYRKFKIRAAKGVNDAAHLVEMLERRLAHPEWRYPDLIAVDGHKAQMNAAKAVLEKYEVRIPVVGVVKDERHRPREIAGDQKIAREHERAILLGNSEAHRFAISYHKKLRGKIS